MGKSLSLVERNSPFVLIRIKPIINFINWLLFFSRIPTNDGSVKYIVTISFDYILRLILVNKLSYDVSLDCVTIKVIIV